MSKTALDLTREERQAYRPLVAIRRRQKKAENRAEKRWQEAWHIAEKAARLLREAYGAEKVMVFGSVARRSGFSDWSDIDLAVWGISPQLFFSAVAAVTGLSSDFHIDLVEPESCSPTLQASIERDGIQL